MIANRGFQVACILLLFLALFGCAGQPGPSSDPNMELKKLFAVAEKVHARVGVYLNDDMRGYIYRQEKSGAPLQMDVGRNLTPVCMTMASAIFDSAVMVDSLPPYMEGARPDVEAVIEPEILYVSGNTGGVLSGQLVSTVKLRIKAYDLSGRIIWQGEATGENGGERVDLVTTMLGNVDQGARAVGLAGINAAVQIIKEFNRTKPPELYAILELKQAPPQKRQKRSAAQEQADLLFRRGMFQYDKKNFQQAIYSFQQADRLDPEDLSNRFYLGVCEMYTGQKRRAIESLNQVIAKTKRGDSLSGNARQWVQRLNDPVKVAILFSGQQGRVPQDLARGFLKSLTSCGIYEIAYVQDTDGPVTQESVKKYLDEAAKKKVRIVLFIQPDVISRDLIDATLREGDFAREFSLNTGTKAFSVQKRKQLVDLVLYDNAAMITRQANSAIIQSALVERSANRVVLTLLGNEIF